MAVLALVAKYAIGGAATAYVAPRLTEFGWNNALTWFGKTFATWAVVALAWNAIVNNFEADEFDQLDLAGSAAATLVIRAVV